jgi:prevent-host-death family protein
MKRKVKVSELKAQLSEHLRHVRRGHTITVMDRDTPIAEIVPLAPERKKPEIRFVSRPEPGLKLGDLHFPPMDPPIEVDAVEILLDMRRDRL